MTTKQIDYRFAALWRFAAAITILTIAGHTYLGFEPSWAQPFVGLATAYMLELLLETISAWTTKRPARYLGGLKNFVSFMLPAHITGLALTMLLYANDRMWPLAFATAVAIGSKYIFRVRVGSSTRHFFNPSNTGIAITFLVFPWVGYSPPYQFTENLAGWTDWIVPGVIILAGSYLNFNYTKKLPLILAWLGGYLAQALIRNLIFDSSIAGALMPMTGLAFLLFTFYMVSDPATTPFDVKGQIMFGFSIAALYAVLMVFHIVFGYFFALMIVCSVRGLWLFVQSFADAPSQAGATVQQPAIAGGD